ncbi:titin [Siniperca chuatsi]|uniref:titin n=1 Tax=Siniperca chuatsi TaxID=119488 RepID=UPI001CE0B7FC|nr:titin [Siniperca chuatsi]XP_044053216.1 titin [Siniperca chuatsi]
MKLYGGFLVPPEGLCSRMHVCVSIWTLPQMTSHLCLLILSSLAASSQLGLEDVFFSPQDQTIKEGEGVFFQCVSGESSPPASITWLKDGILVTRGRQIQGEYGGGNQKKTSGTLHLFNVTLEDDGIYICVTHSPLLNISKKSKPAKLTVQGVPRRLQIIQGPDNMTVAMGTEVSMHCAVRGFPVPMVHWFKDGCILTNCSASFSLQNNGQLLTFRNVTKEDEGSYHCEASNQEESIKSQPAFLLPAEMDWNFVQQPTNLTVKRGENVTVTCRPPYSRPAAQVSWFKNNQLLTPTAHVTVLPVGDLFFHSVQEYDSGSYFCRASNIQLQRFLTSRRAALTVQAPPSVKLWPQVLTVPVGARVVMECQASGHPLPSISWVKRGHSKQTGGKIALGLRNATLYIQSARSYDEGVYVCEASNTLGQSRSTAMLRVAVSPIIVAFGGQENCRIGASVVLPCRAVGILPITYTWTRGRAETQSPISPTEDRHIDEDGALHISSVQYSDAGEYYCTAENRAGRHQRRTILTVTAEHHPADRGKQTRLVLSASTKSSKELPVSHSSDSMAEQHLETTHHPHVQSQHKEATCLSHCDATTNRATTFSTFSRRAAAELKMPPGSLGRLLQHHLNQPATNPTRLLVTQMQPPMLPPPPHPNFQSVYLHTQLPVTSDPLLISISERPITHSQTSVVPSEGLGTTLQYLLTESQSHLTLTSSRTQFQHQVSDELLIEAVSQSSNSRAVTLTSQITEPFTETSMSQPPSKLPVGGPFRFLKLDSYTATPSQSPVTQTKTSLSGSVNQSSASQAELHQSETQLHQLITKSKFYQSHYEPTTTQISQIKVKHPGQPLHQETHRQPSPTLSQISHSDPQQSFTQRLFPKFHFELSTIQHYLPSTQPLTSSVTKPQQSQVHSQPSPTLPKPTSTISTLPQTQPQSSPTQYPLLHSQAPLPQTETFPHQHRNPLKIQPSISTVHPPDQTSDPSTLDPKIPVVHQVNTSDQVQLNISQQGDPVQSAKSTNDTELTELLKRNTSQSPMTSNDSRVTQQSPSWLPVLEKHDIPIVVGVGVSLAFIFITVTFYSVVQKNEPAPTSRAEPIYMSLTAQRNLGVPIRHAERRAAGRTYENRAFEDDDCVAVIEQSPNTSDTRARPPGPSLVTVQMEPTFEDLQEDTQPALDNHSVTVETYPEPILDTKIDPSLEEENGCSLSQPSIQLQCAEDWTSNRGDNRSPCQDALPPPSSLPSRSPSPSPPSRLEEGLHSSLTLQSAEACVAPIHHSLSISHGNPPLLLSHHVSLGLTTVAVDVHFYPAATASMAVSTSTHINSVSNSTSVAAPLFSPPLVNSQENDQSAARFHK